MPKLRPSRKPLATVHQDSRANVSPWSIDRSPVSLSPYRRSPAAGIGGFHRNIRGETGKESLAARLAGKVERRGTDGTSRDRISLIARCRGVEGRRKSLGATLIPGRNRSIRESAGMRLGSDRASWKSVCGVSSRLFLGLTASRIAFPRQLSARPRGRAARNERDASSYATRLRHLEEKDTPRRREFVAGQPRHRSMNNLRRCHGRTIAMNDGNFTNALTTLATPCSPVSACPPSPGRLLIGNAARADSRDPSVARSQVRAGESGGYEDPRRRLGDGREGAVPRAGIKIVDPLENTRRSRSSALPSRRAPPLAASSARMNIDAARFEQTGSPCGRDFN